ncbi:RIP5 [Auxenochlorella protothecoides x Auxenochlorella symbiontica]|uniref:ER membrane protein complex subunit 6 n=1 Tax=Auxenochlorella protothecoides TaxID=3075 RepID=A0A1D1ZUD6_AUXPR
MQAGPVAPSPLLSNLVSDKPLGELAYVPLNIKNNLDVLAFNRIWVSLLTGVLTGCSGLTGFRGFGVYLLGHLLLSILLLVKTKNAPSKYFASSLTLLTSNVFAQTELLTFVLFWTLTNNIVFLF